MVRILYLLLFTFLTVSGTAFSEAIDPFDNTLPGSQTVDDEEKLDELKTADQLIAEAQFLLEEARPLDARTKLLRALRKDPSSFKAHMLLADYYMISVGHFRLALKHVKQAQKLFTDQNGMPPYESKEKSFTHAQLLYLLSQARLNLDDYEGSLRVLDEYKAFGYTSQWYAGSRAWVLMKLGRVDEAIREARIGILEGAEPGRTLNMLGILLSMHGDRAESLRIFRDAIAYELSMGVQGQPATPLNNSGEVYKETFDEDRAESSWLKATSMPDGCEHVLPSLNLTLLYLDQLNLSGAKRAMDNFESCIAQYPLRNGEEHKALLNLARGRIALHAGDPETALHLIQKTLEDRQWFGKIGTNEGDLKAASLASLAQSYRAYGNVMSRTLPLNMFEKLQQLQVVAESKILSWWYFRQARKTLTSDLKDFEDIYVRNTDSLLEYATLGDVTEGLYTTLLERRIEAEKNGDNRKNATPFYAAYLAQNLLASGKTSEGLSLLQQTIQSLRPKYDDLLLIHLLATALRVIPESDPMYADYSERLYTMSRAAPKLYGVKLAASLQTNVYEASDALASAGFLILKGNNRLFHIDLVKDDSIYTLVFTAPQTITGKIKVSGRRLEEVINKATETIFAETVL